jgi:hypothetical protein
MGTSTYSQILSLLGLVAFLVDLGLVLVFLLVLVGEFLPPLTQELANLACIMVSFDDSEKWCSLKPLTELDAGVFLANLVAVVIGEEHVGRKTTLGGVGV